MQMQHMVSELVRYPALLPGLPPSVCACWNRSPTDRVEGRFRSAPVSPVSPVSVACDAALIVLPVWILIRGPGPPPRHPLP
eukprot:994125-Prorocentrum_minimum.AAC.1